MSARQKNATFAIGLKRIGLALLLLMAVAAVWFWSTRARAPDFADVAYGTASDAQKFDVYLPKGTGPFPVVIFAHGGAFKFGSKRDIFGDFKGNIETMNAAGIALVSIDYRMSGEARFPAAVQDMKSATRYLRAKAGQYQIDPARVALWGKSAGAHIALMAGMTSGQKQFDDPASSVGAQSDRVSAVVSNYGPTDFLMMDTQLKAAGCGAGDLTHNNVDSPESLYLGSKITSVTALVTQSNPLTYAGADMPPLLLQHGAKDCTVPAGQSRMLAETVNKLVPGRAVLEIFPDATHGDSAFEAKSNVERIAAFLKQSFARPTAAPN